MKPEKDIKIEDINPFIVQFEISTNEFPAELQNEIRAIYGHLVRAVMEGIPEHVSRNIEKMKSHAFLRHKATKKDVVSNFSLWTGIAGFAVGIIGIIINFL